jgi:DNA-3-methyladenine glycosylase
VSRSADELRRPALTVAPNLLGSVVRSTVGGVEVAVRLTEVEAYMGSDDAASHAFRGPTKRVEVMFGPPGYLYVYFTYGMHWCANIVCEPAGRASAVLLRAGEVIEGIEVARERRPAARTLIDLGRGPARLASCLGLGAAQNGVNLLDPGAPVRLELARRPRATDIRSGPRVGITKAAERPWRFWLGDDPTVSAFRPGRASGGSVRLGGDAPAN